MGKTDKESLPSTGRFWVHFSSFRKSRENNAGKIAGKNRLIQGNHLDTYSGSGIVKRVRRM